MSQYVGCEHARTLLEGLIDGELSMPEQLAVESHLRWCDTCAFRVQDMRLIGASLRARSATQPDDRSDAELEALNEGLLMRVRAERAESLPSRLREMFVDMRLLWPALGATAAVLLCVAASVSVLHASASREPDSLAAIISALGSPGSELNPLRPADNGITIPRLRDKEEGFLTGGTLEEMPAEDVIYTIRTVVGRDGSTSNYEVLLGDDPVPANRQAAARAAAEEVALLNAVRKTRFLPAKTPLGRAVAVDMVWVLAKTTIVAAGPPESLRARSVPESRVKDATKPALPERGIPISGQPSNSRRSATA
jgi:putative zinc finger protein